MGGGRVRKQRESESKSLAPAPPSVPTLPPSQAFPEQDVIFRVLLGWRLSVSGQGQMK